MEPLEFEFTVGCSPEHAFEMWALRTSLWWPHDHSVSGESGLTVIFEPRPGGRIYERTPRGAEHDWGQVLTWEPPHRLTYLWHIAWDRSDATEVDISFAGSQSGTGVRIVHRGWERLGSKGQELHRRNREGWARLVPHYQRACAA